MMAAIQYLSLLFLLYSSVDGHSWPENPRPRQYRWAIEGGCVEDETGKVYPICGKDANGLDIKNLRPASYLQAPCTFARTVSASSTTTSPTNPNQNSQNHRNRPAPAAYDAEFPRSVLRVGAPLCVSWAANAHDRDVHRNEGSTRGVRFAISEKAEPTMADFDKGVLGSIPYEKFEGALLAIPRHRTPTPGTYTMLFSWDWPVGAGPKFANAGVNDGSPDHLFARCMDVVVLPAADADADAGADADAARWPMGTHVRPVPPECAEGSRVFGLEGDGGGNDDSSNANDDRGVAPTLPDTLPPTPPPTPSPLPTLPPTMLRTPAHPLPPLTPPATPTPMPTPGIVGAVPAAPAAAPACANCQNDFGTDTGAYCNYNGHCHGGVNEGKCCDPRGRARCACELNPDVHLGDGGATPPTPTPPPTPPLSPTPPPTPPPTEPDDNDNNGGNEGGGRTNDPPAAVPAPAPACAVCLGDGAYCNYNGHCHGGSNEGKCCDADRRAKCLCSKTAQ